MLPHTSPAAVRAALRDYDDLPDRHLATTLAEEDLAEEFRGLSPPDRVTCRTHRRWVHQCVASPAHVIVVTGHRWCRACQCAVTVAVDELAFTVTLICPRCKRVPNSAANRQLIRTCLASLAAAHEHHDPCFRDYATPGARAPD
jgi:hypothetical protein